jgi:uncharacterized membrane protein
VTAGAARRVPVALAVVLSGAFAVATHMALVDGLPRSAGAFLSLVPISILALALLRRARHRVVALGLVAIAVAAFALNWPELERHFPGVFFLEHAGGMLALAAIFGRTLFGGREPLVTTFARITHGTIGEDIARYTRRVTVAWTLFFLAIATASAALYTAGLLEAWSFLVNFLTAPLIAAMFVIEYLVRHRVLPDHERVGILGGMRAFSRHFG